MRYSLTDSRLNSTIEFSNLDDLKRQKEGGRACSAPSSGGGRSTHNKLSVVDRGNVGKFLSYQAVRGRSNAFAFVEGKII